MPAAAPWFPPGFPADEWRITRRGAGRSSTHLDAVLTTLADAQHGVVARAQLLALGGTDDHIATRLRSGHLHRARPGAYAGGRRTLLPSGVRMAAVLAAGEDARLAGWSAATHRRVLPEAGALVDVAIPPRRRVVLRGVAPRRVPARPGDVELVDGIPSHAVAPMLLDIAAVNDAGTLEWAWRPCIFGNLLDVREIARLLGDRDGAPGTPALRALYERRAALVGQLRNRFELRMLSIIREAGLPEPLCNAPFEVAPGLTLHPDFRIPQLGLVIESDGRDGHQDVEFLLSDDHRDEPYRANGHRAPRYGWWETRRERGRLVADLRAFAAGAWNIAGSEHR